MFYFGFQFWKAVPHVAQAGLKHVILLSLPPTYTTTPSFDDYILIREFFKEIQGRHKHSNHSSGLRYFYNMSK